MENQLSELTVLEKHTLKMLKVLEDYLRIERDVATKLAAAKKLASLLEELISTTGANFLDTIQESINKMSRAALMAALGQGADLAEGDHVGFGGQLAQAMMPFEEVEPQEQLCAIIDPLLLGGKVKEAVDRVSELTGWTIEESATVIRGRQEQLIKAYEQKNTFGQPIEGLALEIGEDEGEGKVREEDVGNDQEQRGEAPDGRTEDPSPNPGGDPPKDNNQETV